MIDTLHCPLCSKPAPRGQSKCNSSHPTVALSWEHDSVEMYEGWYTSDSYHNEQYKQNRGETCLDLYEEAKRAAYARWGVIGAVLNDGRCKRVMDIGAGNMAAVHVAQAEGHTAHGIDPHPLRKDCWQGSWRDVSGPYDIITMFDVLEHLVHPYQALCHLRDCLAPSGILVVEMPELNAPNENWRRHIKPQEHICLYSKEGAEFLYDMAGFEVIGFYRPVRGSLGKMSHLLKEKETEGG